MKWKRRRERRDRFFGRWFTGVESFERKVCEIERLVNAIEIRLINGMEYTRANLDDQNIFA